MSPMVNVRELIAWDLDDYAFRSTSELPDRHASEQVIRAQAHLARRPPYTRASAVLEAETQAARTHLDRASLQPDLHEDYRGLDWSLAVVDLRRVLAFQRRLILPFAQQPTAPPAQEDWEQLLRLALGHIRTTRHSVVQGTSLRDRTDIRLQSSNPDFQVRLTLNSASNDSLPLALYGGSPNFEVAEFRGRWFLRDGYHRAYHLLRHGIQRMPAVVLRARSIEELGATEPWFFPERELFSERPPQLTDFLEEELTSTYPRIALRKVIEIHIKHSLEPPDECDPVEREQP